MKNNIIYILSALVIILIIILALVGADLQKANKNLHIQESNVISLLQGQEEFKVRDSLNAVRVNELQLTLDVYKQYHEDDMALIKDMGIKSSNLSHVTHSSSETTYTIHTTVKDSTVYDTVPVQLINYNDPYISMNGRIRDKQFDGSITSYDTILIAEEIKYKRFLGFLWKTNKIKSHKVTAVSKNPHTKLNIQSVSIN